MNNSVLINQTSGQVEYYTPGSIIEPARQVMGGIDLDPASCALANQTVKATAYFTIADDGLSKPWAGRIWMNPPFGRSHNPLWVRKLVCEYEAGQVTQACCIVFASTSEGWFQPLTDHPLCLVARRVNYIGPDGRVCRGVTRGSVVAYLGPHVDRFASEFRHLGRVYVPYQLPGTQCVICGAGFEARRADTIYCSAACRQKAKRSRQQTARGVS